MALSEAPGVERARSAATVFEPWLRATGTLARLFVLLLSVATLWLARTGAPAVVLAGAVAVSLVALYAVDRRSGGFGLWAAYLLGFVLFAHLRTLADETGIQPKGQYVLDAEEELFAGTIPSEWLQRRLFDEGVGMLAVASAVVYLSYFVVPHAVALALWKKNPNAFRRYGLALLIAVYAGLAVSVVVPTAPPWLAADHSNGPQMTRVLADTLGWNLEQGGAGTNPFAAMPSLHVALTVLVVAAAWRRRFLRELAAAYLLAMTFVLVATGEHYVVDAIAGAAVALLAWSAAPLLLGHRAAAERPPERGTPDRPPGRFCQGDSARELSLQRGCPSAKGGGSMRARVWQFIAGLRKDEGQTAVEYGVLLALILAISVGVIQTVGIDVLGAFTDVANAIGS